MIQPCISLFKRTYGNKCHQTQHNMMVPIKLQSVLQAFHCSGTAFNCGLWGIGREQHEKVRTNEEGGGRRKKGTESVKVSSHVTLFLSTSSSPGSPYTGNRSVRDFVGALFPPSPPPPPPALKYEELY